MIGQEVFNKSVPDEKPKIPQYLLFIICFVLAGASICPGENPRSGPSVDFSHGRLKISDNKRFIIHDDGTPFFYL